MGSSLGLKSCCCGCSLKKGSLVIGYILAILNGLGGGYSLVSGLFLGGTSFHDVSDTPDPGAKLLTGVFMSAAIIGCMSLAMHSMMIYGIYKTKPAFVLAWMTFFGAGIALQCYGVVSALSLTAYLSFGQLLIAMMTILVLFVLQVYCLVVVSSHYHTMRKISLFSDDGMSM